MVQAGNKAMPFVGQPYHKSNSSSPLSPSSSSSSSVGQQSWDCSQLVLDFFCQDQGFCSDKILFIKKECSSYKANQLIPKLIVKACMISFKVPQTFVRTKFISFRDRTLSIQDRGRRIFVGVLKYFRHILMGHEIF